MKHTFSHLNKKKLSLSQTKHHWWWKTNRVFNGLKITKDFHGSVLFIEVTPFICPTSCVCLSSITNFFVVIHFFIYIPRSVSTAKIFVDDSQTKLSRMVLLPTFTFSFSRRITMLLPTFCMCWIS